jgi:hypothetical protein
MRAVAGALLIVAAAICFAAAVIAAEIGHSKPGGGSAPDLGLPAIIGGSFVGLFGLTLLLVGLGSDAKK